MKTELKTIWGFWQTIDIHGTKESKSNLVTYLPGLWVGSSLSMLEEEEPEEIKKLEFQNNLAGGKFSQDDQILLLFH